LLLNFTITFIPERSNSVTPADFIVVFEVSALLFSMREDSCLTIAVEKLLLLSWMGFS
jgi:hypothetical protein